MAPRNAPDEAGFKRLVELETEYRTQRTADQLHAIASFTHLFDECPYPVIINAAVLKLADYFRNSNNIQRHAILQVFKKSHQHLNKVINVEETIKRISPMLQSNDPLARAITLRVLGCMATIVSDRIDVYHKVIHSLDSLEAMEVSAAVYAADMICAQSQRFCAIISGKLAFMVRDTKTPLPLKRRLIRIFGHMFEDITLARLDGEYTVAILRTLTRLASHSLVDVDQQIELLLQRAQDQTQAQPGIRRVALMCIGLLAQKSIEFSPAQIKAIFDVAVESKDERTTLRAMVALDKIFRLTGVMTSISLVDSGADTMKSYIQASLHILERAFSSLSSSLLPSWSPSRLVVLECYAVLSVMLPYYRRSEAAGFSSTADKTFQEAVKVVTQSMEQFFVKMWSRYGDLQGAGNSNSNGNSNGGILVSKEDISQSKRILWALVTLTLEEGSGVDVLLKTLLEWVDTYKDVSALVAKALLHITRQQPRKAYAMQDVILAYLENNVDSPDTQTFILVYRVLLESSVLYHATPSSSATMAFESRVSQILDRFGQVDMLERFTKNHWELYQVGRYSLQAGWSSLALNAFRNQEKCVTSVSASLWLMTVQTVALIESSLQTAATVGSDSRRQKDEEQEEGKQRGDDGRLDLYSQQQMYIKVVGYLEKTDHRQSDNAIEILQTMCLIIAFAIQRVAKILDRMGSSRSGGDEGKMLQGEDRDMDEDDDDAEDDVFDIDPLLIPLLFLQEQEEQQQDDGEQLVGGGQKETFLDVFKTSTRKTLGFVDKQVKGRDIDALERGISIVRQLISQYISFPIPIPQEFFVAGQALQPTMRS
ncbi:Integrator complex subunit 7 [Dissophora ornata]|nr:Integrator complex subunit 7 [Dissophora ornata]